jgi:hypothetical protein
VTDDYTWHSNALRGVFADDLPITEDAQPGWYKTRLVKGGPFVPARVFVEREYDSESGDLLTDERLRIEVNGRIIDEEKHADAWLGLAKRPITQAEYDYMTAVALHAGWHDTKQPQANPHKPIDWLSVRPPIFKR